MTEAETGAMRLQANAETGANASTPRIASSRQKPRTDSPPQPPEGTNPTNTLTLDFCLQNCERVDSCYFKPPSLQSPVTAALRI